MSWSPQVEERVRAALVDAARPRPAADDVQDRVDAAVTRRRRRVLAGSAAALLVVAATGAGLARIAAHPGELEQAAASASASRSRSASRSSVLAASSRAEAQATETGTSPGVAFRRLAESLPRGAAVHVQPRLQAGATGDWTLVSRGHTAPLEGNAGGADGTLVQEIDGGVAVGYQTMSGEAAVLRLMNDGRSARSVLGGTGGASATVVDRSGTTGLVAYQHDGERWTTQVVDVSSPAARVLRAVPLPTRQGWTVTQVTPLAVSGGRALLDVYFTQGDPASAAGAQGEQAVYVVGADGRARAASTVSTGGSPSRVLVDLDGCGREVAARDALDEDVVRRAPCVPKGGQSSQTGPGGRYEVRTWFPGTTVSDGPNGPVTSALPGPSSVAGRRTLELGDMPTDVTSSDGQVAVEALDVASGRSTCLIHPPQSGREHVWEDPTHLLYLPGGGAPDESGIRIDVGACTAERAPMPDGVQSLSW